MNTEHGLMMAPAANRAVMLTRGQLASHFTRAEQLQIVSPEGTVLATLPNPAAGEGCGGKQALLVTLKAHQVNQVNQVVVRNIGERMLGRLLTGGMQVVQCRSARLPWPALLAEGNLQPLTEPSQGRRSQRHAGKPVIHAIKRDGHDGAERPPCQGGCCGEGNTGCHNTKEANSCHCC
ncbi:NifB/NifX family molybdenum-iron cluster-binding protein [Aeromonas salmonicida]|uniref:NifB/NifX family molybdenum-iron cluster-binding protein n=1 Tax=Aeromonas salmonicida TaxID=645 RepID=UPI0038B8E4AF